MVHSEVGLKVLPSFVAINSLPSQLAIFCEHACLENQAVGGGKNLFGRVWVIGCNRHIDCVVDLFDKNLHRLVYIAIFANALVVPFKIDFGDFGISGVEVRQHLQCGDVGVTDVIVMEGTYISLVNAGNQQGFKGPVSAVVFTILTCLDK